jgi:8-oxo-dGTP pyrophosphatase MutT (NUDIX family)
MPINIAERERSAMQTRKTARALLIDRSSRILLMRMHDPDVGGATGAVEREAYWVTIGGEIDPGEDIETAVRREIAEETGREAARIGPAVWYTEHVLTVRGEPRLLQETFVVAFAEHEGLSDAHWTELERAVVKDMKWWEMDALLKSRDTFFPTSLRTHLPEILAGRYPGPVLRIEP